MASRFCQQTSMKTSGVHLELGVRCLPVLKRRGNCHHMWILFPLLKKGMQEWGDGVVPVPCCWRGAGAGANEVRSDRAGWRMKVG